MNSEPIFTHISEEVESNPHDYSYLMGLLYANGIGCEPSFRLAKKYFEDAYVFGDVRGADAIITLYEERLQQPDLEDWERSYCEKEISSWRILAAKYIRHDFDQK